MPIESVVHLLPWRNGDGIRSYLAAIAVVVYGTYKALGNNIGSLANGVDSALTNAPPSASTGKKAARHNSRAVFF